jgi:hypothetical protein
MPSVYSNVLLSAWLLYWGIRSLVGINKENMRSYFILESIVLPRTVILLLQCEVSHFYAIGTSFLFPEVRSYSKNYLKQMRQNTTQYSLFSVWHNGTNSLWMIPWLSKNVTIALIFLLFNSIFCVSWRALGAPFHVLSFYLEIILETPDIITRYNWVKQGKIIIHRLSKFLLSLQSYSLPYIGQAVRNKPRADLWFWG